MVFEISNRFKAEKRLRSSFKYLNVVAVFSLKRVSSEKQSFRDEPVKSFHVTCFYVGLLQQMEHFPL